MKDRFLAYVLPFAVFIAFIACAPVFTVPQWLRLVIEVVLISAFSQGALAGNPSRPWSSVLLGVFVFAVWIGPDQLIPGYRQLPLFSNSWLSHRTETGTHALAFLVPRVLVSVVAVPVLEELFWRGFLMRWLIHPDFSKVPLGAWSPLSFWTVAVLFASEHGAYWDVGLVAGILYNWWMLRTRNLWDCILAHAVTNACLAAWVITRGQWQYWL